MRVETPKTNERRSCGDFMSVAMWEERNAARVTPPAHCIHSCLDGVGFGCYGRLKNTRWISPSGPQNFSMTHFLPRDLLLVLVLSCMGLAACAGAPVQEMSNARQAIKAARAAGAEKIAPQKLNEAEALLDRAEDNLHRRAYRDARRDAIAARGKAAEALDSTQLPVRNDSG